MSAKICADKSARYDALRELSGSIDFGFTGASAGFYSLGGQGVLKIIGGGFAREAPGFYNLGYVVSNQAFAGGFKSLKDFPGHSVAISQTGSPPHYALGLLIEKYGFDEKTIRVLPLQSVANMTSALTGGQADAAALTATAALPLVQRGEAHLLRWVGDETPWELGSAFTATRTANDRRDTVERFVRALRKAAYDCHEAFAGSDEKPHIGPTTPEVLAIIAKYTGATAGTIKVATPFCDPEARLDVKDVLHQIAWYKSQSMVRPEVDGQTIIDKRYVTPLPEP